jgi:hypothetical protein
MTVPDAVDVPAAECTRVGHCQHDVIDTYAGRGPGGRDFIATPVGERGWLGSPYTLDDHGRVESVEKFAVAFRYALERDPALRAAVAALAGETLGCWCQDLEAEGPACHAEVVAGYAELLAAQM